MVLEAFMTSYLLEVMCLDGLRLATKARPGVCSVWEYY